ncbi:glycosyltransferase family 4 protein [Aestuariibaculum suncheonense]|uniref:Glycosyltransferase family 4 protein n=1 Tax=Aestuariibaculum suncheonense TaxID=1028745 RepID=A0A8J6QYW5_9FLAO|nr:glycosyltransferase family 4 protein [Aestuariibaculum suncheonense]MBD0837024.1 glycosyltransferase family 4 protein [Aestuariibaculum suncheonense]
MSKRFKLIFFFIPYHHIGGAERVHLNIIKTLHNKPIVFFNSAKKESISSEFRNHAYCFKVSSRRQKKMAVNFVRISSVFFELIVFGSNSNLFYKLVSKLKLKLKVKIIDLTHAFSFPELGMEQTSLPFVDLIDRRIVINTKTKEDYKKLYLKHNISLELLDRFIIIPNGIIIGGFDEKEIDVRFKNFTIGFVGRNSKEKRPEIFFDILKETGCKGKVIGDHFDNFKTSFSDIEYFENCNNPKQVREHFSRISLLIVSSSREGFPLVIMEAMELGIPVIATDVGSISDHVKNNFNGFIGPIKTELFIIFSKHCINNLIGDYKLYKSLAVNARNYAEANFDIEKFNSNYRELFYE